MTKIINENFNTFSFLLSELFHRIINIALSLFYKKKSDKIEIFN